MANYPDNYFVPRTRNNKEGIVYEPSDKETFFVEDINKGDDEIVAIQNELGKNPSGDFDNVKKRIEAIERGGIDRVNIKIPTVSSDPFYLDAYSTEFLATGAIIKTSDTRFEIAKFYTKQTPPFCADFGKNPKLSVVLKINSMTDTDINFGMGDRYFFDYGPYAGFNFYGGNLHCKVADHEGYDVSDEIITGVDLSVFNHFRIEYETGVGAKFYVNNVLKSTLNNSLPDGYTGSPFRVDFRNFSDTTDAQLHFRPFTYSQDI